MWSPDSNPARQDRLQSSAEAIGAYSSKSLSLNIKLTSLVSHNQTHKRRSHSNFSVRSPINLHSKLQTHLHVQLAQSREHWTNRQRCTALSAQVAVAHPEIRSVLHFTLQSCSFDLATHWRRKQAPWWNRSWVSPKKKKKAPGSRSWTSASASSSSPPAGVVCQEAAPLLAAAGWCSLTAWRRTTSLEAGRNLSQQWKQISMWVPRRH